MVTLASSRSQLWRLGFIASFMLMALAILGCKTEADVETIRELNRKQQQATASSKGSESKLLQEISRAKVLLQDNQAKAAEGVLRPLLLVHPDHQSLWLLYAQCQFALTEYSSAIDAARRIDHACEECLNDAQWLIGQCFFEQGQYHEALTPLRELLNVKKYHSLSRHRLALICNALGYRLRAADYLNELAKQQDLSEKEAFSLICLVDAFIDDTLSARSISPLAKAMQERADGHYEEALELIKSTGANEQDAALTNAFYCRLLAETGDFSTLQHALGHAPVEAQHEANYWFARGILLESSGKLDEAVRCFLEGVQRDPTDSQAYVHLAQNLERIGQTAPAHLARERAYKVAKTIQIARRFGARAGTQTEYLELASLLGELQRDWEAVAWQRIAIKAYGSDVKQQQQLQSNIASAKQCSENEIMLANACGLAKEDWPLNDNHLNQTVEKPGAEKRASLATNVPFDFKDIAAELGVTFQYDSGDNPNDDRHLLHQMTGGGIAVIDFDLDGWSDVYFGQGGGDAFATNQPKANLLYRNLGGVQACDVTNLSQSDDRGYAQGVTAADLDQDGFYDLVIANIGPNAILWNKGDGTFVRETFPESTIEMQWTSSVVAGDLDGDSLPELIELNYVDDAKAMQVVCTPKSDLCNPSVFRAAISRAYTICSDGTVQNWTGTDWLNQARSYSFAGIIANLDRQAGNDMFIANDADDNAYLVSQLNDSSTGKFSLMESALIRGCAGGLIGQQQGCMGIAAGDFDRNGYLDLHVTNFWNQPSDLYLGQESGVFQNGSVRLGLHSQTQQTVGWGTQAIDVDNNGWQDLVIMNGHTADHRQRGEPFAMRPQLFQGSQEGFSKATYGKLSEAFWNKPTMGRTLATLDWNRDGRIDFVANHLDQPATLMTNQTIAANYLQLTLVGVESEREAIGARVVAYYRGEVQTQWCTGGDGFLCTNTPTLHFGLGDSRHVDRMDVYWPSGSMQSFSHVVANTNYLLIENEASLIEPYSSW